jgi:hypothetical protein
VKDDPSQLRLVVPASLRWVVLGLCHDYNQHFDWHRSLSMLQCHYWFPGMAEVVRRYVGECSTCQKQRNFQYFRDKYGVELADRMSYATPASCFGIDLKSMPADPAGNTWILVVTCLFSRFVITVPLK